MISLGNWITIVVQIVTLIAILYSGYRVIERNVEEWRQRELRLQNIESELKELRNTNITIARVDTKLGELTSEIMRVRDRLDTFLDKKSNQ